VNGAATLSSLGLRSGAEEGLPTEHPSGRNLESGGHKGNSPRASYRLDIAYLGSAFQCFAKDRNLRTVVGLLEAALQPHCSSGRLDIQAAGRTDAGVTAVGQVLSFHTYDSPTADAIAAAVDGVAPGHLRACTVARVPRAFHATFSACWRRYVYLFPLRSAFPRGGVCDCVRHGKSAALGDTDTTHVDLLDVQPAAVDRLLQPLVGKTLDFSAFARDTAAGKDSRCRLHIARASVVRLPPPPTSNDPGDEGAVPAMMVELAGDRFLRRMVRVLVATAIRESLHPLDDRSPGVASPDESPPISDSRLVALCHAGDRLATAMAMPPLGLCLVEAGYPPYAPAG